VHQRKILPPVFSQQKVADRAAFQGHFQGRQQLVSDLNVLALRPRLRTVGVFTAKQQQWHYKRSLADLVTKLVTFLVTLLVSVTYHNLVT